jgi:hypothetical protein
MSACPPFATSLPGGGYFLHGHLILCTEENFVRIRRAAAVNLGELYKSTKRFKIVPKLNVS